MSSSSPSPPKRARKQGSIAADVLKNVSQPKAFSTPLSTPAVQKAGPTPYSTPFVRRRTSLCPPNTKDAATRKAVNKLSNILNKPWYAFNVSPLYNMNYSEASLKRFARRLKERLLAHLSAESSAEYEVSYTSYPEMKLYKEDHEALMVSVEKISEKGKTSVAYHAILFSWGAAKGLQLENAVFLPILICRGLKSIIRQVHTEFQLIHDCFINSFDMHEEDLRMFSIIMLQNFPYKDEDMIKLSYRLPLQKRSDVLDITLPASVLCNLWKSIHTTSCPDPNDHEITTFWGDVHAHTYRSFGIDLGPCHLVKVTFPDTVFNHDAIYSKKKDKMHMLLCYLMNLTDVLLSLAPQMHDVILPPEL